MNIFKFIFSLFVFSFYVSADYLKCENFQIKAIYVGASNKILRKIDFAKENSINAFVIDVKNDIGEITCDLGDKRFKSNGNISDIKALLSELKKQGIYTIARIVTFQDKVKLEESPDFAIQNKDGSIYIDKEKKKWLNPYSKEVQQYILDIAKLAAKLGFDEIQFDYIRFPPFRSLQNTNIEDNLKNQTKIDLINEFLKQAVDELHKLNVKVSVDVFGCVIPECMGELTEESSRNLGQDYCSMAAIADYICPMIYPSHWPYGSFKTDKPDLKPAVIVGKSMELSQKFLGMKHSEKVRPYLQAFSATWLKKGSWKAYGAEEVQAQIDACLKTNLNQFCLWNPSGKYSCLSDPK